MRLLSATESVGSLNSVGPLNVSPRTPDPLAETRADVERLTAQLAAKDAELLALRSAYEELRHAALNTMLLLNGQTEPLHPLSWQVELTQLRAALASPSSTTQEPTAGQNTP